ncbi:MAG: hypothetical protein K2X39_02995 [Silvanigrellaceae bacterium]|nr:hypothetical protein [Silvanigrellaceae bacterium]
MIGININKFNKNTYEGRKIGEALQDGNYISHIWGLNEKNTTDLEYAINILKGTYIGLDDFKKFISEGLIKKFQSSFNAD